MRDEMILFLVLPVAMACTILIPLIHNAYRYLRGKRPNIFQDYVDDKYEGIQ